MTRTVDVAIVGLGFGEDFLPVYQAHPAVGRVAIVDTDERRLTDVGDRYGVADRFTDVHALLATDAWDAVHVLAPVSFHAALSLAVLESGRHCACAVPMATSLDDVHALVEAQARTGLVYTMMETAVRGLEYAAVERLHRGGALGTLTGYHGFHVQNLDGYPSYWRGYPPMQYATHALAPALALEETYVEQVVCLGSGRLTPDRVGASGNPFPTQVGLFTLAGSDLLAQVTLSFFQTARPYTEGFDVYGDAGSVEWPRVDGDPLRYYALQELDPTLPDRGLRGRRSTLTPLEPVDETAGLPAEVTPYLSAFDVPDGTGGTLRRDAEHGGSHPRLVHEFVTACVTGTQPPLDAVTSARFTAPGICAHESSLRHGTPVAVPSFTTSQEAALAGATKGSHP